METTIAAIVTPPGIGGVGIIRLSGAQALTLGKAVFQPAKPNFFARLQTNHLYYGYAIRPQNGAVIDEIFFVYMQEPRSFTGEDVVELQTHGGYIVLQSILEELYALGARPAEPGEYSKRAFLNGRLDLTQAEAIIDIIEANSKAGLGAAVAQLQGKLKMELTWVNHKLLRILSYWEAALDFPEDEITDYHIKDARTEIQACMEKLQNLLQSYQKGKILREGMSLAIIGKPNVGKSSLLNALLGENRAIVTSIPGTTRDTIEEWYNLDGFAIKIIDSAGIHNTSDLVEKLGVAKSLELLERADLVCAVFDTSTPRTKEDEEILKMLAETAKSVILVANKTDKKKHWQPEQDFLAVSAKNGTGLANLLAEIKVQILAQTVTTVNTPLLTRARHVELIQRAYMHLEDLNQALELLPLDFLTIDLRSAWQAIGEVTGDALTDNLLDKIFKEFCLGK